MALTSKLVTNFASFRGSPTSDTVWDKLSWGFDARQLKIIVKQGSTSPLEVSIDGKDIFMSLPEPEANMNPMVYDFSEINLSRIHVRKTGADVEIYAFGIY